MQHNSLGAEPSFDAGCVKAVKQLGVFASLGPRLFVDPDLVENTPMQHLIAAIEGVFRREETFCFSATTWGQHALHLRRQRLGVRF